MIRRENWSILVLQIEFAIYSTPRNERNYTSFLGVKFVEAKKGLNLLLAKERFCDYISRLFTKRYDAVEQTLGEKRG